MDNELDNEIQGSEDTTVQTKLQKLTNAKYRNLRC